MLKVGKTLISGKMLSTFSLFKEGNVLISRVPLTAMNLLTGEIPDKLGDYYLLKKNSPPDS
jgi:hypothetical protein